MSRRLLILALVVLIAGALAAAAWLAWTARPADRAAPGAAYLCPMHPEVTSEVPGSCPICGMDLVPATPPPSPSSRERTVPASWKAERTASCACCG